MTEQNINLWRKCSTCKKPILLNSKYYVCSVSTCNGQRTGYVFCSMQCFETHLPGARHRDAGAIEKIAPKTVTPTEFEQQNNNSGSQTPSNISSSQSAHGMNPQNNLSTNNPTPSLGRRIIVSANATSKKNPTNTGPQKLPQEILIIASRLKEYVQIKAEMNTSASVMDILSDIVRELCDEAIENARRDGRKTVMDRDFKP